MQYAPGVIFGIGIAKEKEIVGKKLAVNARVLRGKAKKLATKAGKVVKAKGRLEGAAEEQKRLASAQMPQKKLPGDPSNHL